MYYHESRTRVAKTYLNPPKALLVPKWPPFAAQMLSGTVAELRRVGQHVMRYMLILYISSEFIIMSH